MKRFGRIMSLALAVVISAGIFTGCGNEDVAVATDTSSAVAGTSSAKSTENEAPITINWMPQNDAQLNMDSPVIQQLQEKLNVKFNFVYIDRNKEVEILNMRIASGDIPDVMKVTEERFRTYISQGVLADFSEEQLKEFAPNMYDLELKNGGDLAWEYAKEDGKIYGLPALNPNGAYNFVPIWRDDWLKNVGISKIPQTLAEAEDAFKKFVNNDPDKNGLKDTYALSNTGMSVIFGAYGGVPYFSKGGGLGFTWSLVNDKVQATATMPEMKEALTLLNKWYSEGLIDPEFISEENKGQYWGNSVTFWNNKVGFSCPGLSYHVNKPYFDGDTGSGNYQNFIKLQPNGSYDFGTPLVGPNGKSGTEKWGTFPGNYVVFGKQVSEDPKKLQKILEINERVVSDPEIFMLSRLGIKDVTYKELSTGGYSNTGDALDAEKVKTLGLVTQGIGYLNEVNFELMKECEVDRFLTADKIGKFGDNYVNVVWGGLPSAAQYKATVEKKIRESYILFITGEKKVSEFDSYVSDLNKAGLEQLTKEANDWYNKYNKK